MTAYKPALWLMALLTLTSCGLLPTRTSAPFVPPAGCSERAVALKPPPPPNSRDYRKWADAYTGAVGAYEDSENKRAATADCMDEHRK